MFHISRPFLAALRVYSTSRFVVSTLIVYLLLIGLIVGIEAHTIRWRQSISFPMISSVINWSQLPSDPSKVSALSINSSGPIEQVTNEMWVALQPGSPLRKAGAMPRLKHLVIYGGLNESQLISLLEHRQLESLSISYLESMSPAGWQAVSRQPLKTLDILATDDKIWKDANFPGSLETLLVRNQSSLQRSAIGSQLIPLRVLQKLRTLQLPYFETNRGELAAADQEVLASLRSLRTLYVAEMAPGFRDRVQLALPHLQVRSVIYEASRISKVTMLLLLAVLPMMLILHVLSIQFSTPMSQLTPKFERPHFQAAAAIFLAFACTQALSLFAVRCSVVASLALALAAIAPACFLTYLFSTAGSFPGYINLATTLPVMVIQIPLVGVVMFLAPADVDWFLAGNRLDVSFLLVLAGGLGILLIGKIFTRLSRGFAESTANVVPFDVWDMTAFQREMQKGNLVWWQDFVWSAWSRGQNRRLARCFDRLEPASYRQAVLWDGSKTMTAFEFAVYMGCSMALMGIIWSLVAPAPPFWGVIPGTILIQVLFLTLLSPAIVLQAQKSFLASHLLMSVPRNDWVRLIFRETAWDYLPTVIPMAIGVLGLHWWGPTELWPLWHLALIACAMILLTYGLQLTLATYPAWVQFIVAACLPTIFFLGVMLGANGFAAHTIVATIINWPPTWWLGPFALGILSIRFAYHRWMNWELGRMIG